MYNIVNKENSQGVKLSLCLPCLSSGPTDMSMTWQHSTNGSKRIDMVHMFTWLKEYNEILQGAIYRHAKTVLWILIMILQNLWFQSFHISSGNDRVIFFKGYEKEGAYLQKIVKMTIQNA